MADDKRISELPLATTPLAGTEELEIVQGGVNKRVASSNVGSGGTIASVTGQNNAVDNTDTANPIVRNGVREVTGASASVIGDNNGLVKFNSATPFNFTLDQLAAGTKISFVNYGAGAVTFINGSGVTLAGNAVLSGAVGTAYPSCVVIYDTLTTPRILNSSANSLTLVSVDTTGATITLDFLLEKERMFEGSASFATAKAVTLANDTNALVLMVTFNLTNVAAVLTFDSEFVMSSTDSRWDNTGKTFTVPSGMTGVYKFTAAKNIAGTVWRMEATNQFPS